MTSSNLTNFSVSPMPTTQMWHQNEKNLNTSADTTNKELEQTFWYMSNKPPINFQRTSAILFSNSLNAQNDSPDVFFKLGKTTRKIERIKDLVRFSKI